MTKKTERPRADDAGRYAFAGLDRALHEKARLGALAALVAHPDGLRFGDLKRLCALTDGNLSRHLDVLREAHVIELWKGFAQRRPQTLIRLTPDGRRRFLAYLEALDHIVRDALPKTARPAGRPKPMPPGWQPA